MKRFHELDTKELVPYDEQEELRNMLIDLAHDAIYMNQKKYDGPLGAIYSKEFTEFRLWAPTASQVELIIYEDYYGQATEQIVMEEDYSNNIFKLKLEGDLHGLTYRYRLVFLDGTTHKTVDPYAKAVTVNGQRSVVVDLERTNPENWGTRMPAFSKPSDAIVYELHVRDLSSSKSSGIRNQRKYIGAIEKGTVNRYGSSTGLDYIKELGVTHVEFLPIFDYQTIDETMAEPLSYNWGYDPQNYNVPEGSYSTNPYDPFCRIKETKEMIQGFHDEGIRVIMDVVYNHVYEVETQSLFKTVPGYHFRYDNQRRYTNGTGVGNDTASERYMMRKYIVDSVVYWAKEYHIDGFRFDLMGIHDIETMNAVREALDEIDPSIIVFGEGWNLNTPLDHHKKAMIENAKEMPRIGFFNDGLREALKGNDFDSSARGFINGAWYMENLLVNNFIGGGYSGRFDNPMQLVQYVEAHDNYTLYDRLLTADPEIDPEILVRRHELASTIILLSQGIPFIHAGQEFLRTKYGVRDSYNKPDSINKMDWNRREEYKSTVNLVRDLIQLRKQEPAFRLGSYEEINRIVEVVRTDYQIVQVHFNMPEYRLIVVFSAQSNLLRVPLEQGNYIAKLHNGTVYLDDETIYEEIDQVSIEPYSSLILKQYR